MGENERSGKLQKQRREASKRYHEKIERIVFYVPDGQKSVVQSAAEQSGESINGFVNKAVLHRIGMSEWPSKAASKAAERMQSDD